MPAKLPRSLPFVLMGTFALCAIMGSRAGADDTPWRPDVPTAWDDEALRTLEVPLAETDASPVHIPAELFYRLPERTIYKGHPVYHPDHEPAGYLETLKQRGSKIAFEASKLVTREDWIRAGELVFDAPIMSNALIQVGDVRDPAWYERTGVPVAADGTVPFVRYLVRDGQVRLGQFSCGTCHTRVMPDGTTIKGAQGNFPLSKLDALETRKTAARMGEEQYVQRSAPRFRGLFGAPWLPSEEQIRYQEMTAEQIAAAFEAIPPGVQPRFAAGLMYPVVVPDLIGIRDLRYLDRTGHTRHRDVGDVMRYSAIQQDVGLFARYRDWIPFGRLPDPDAKGPFRRTRYSDDQLYALALYLYSLKPPANPNPFDELAARGQKVFEREECWRCHRPPVYTNNKLTPARGFDPPADHPQARDVVPLSVGTDAGLTLKTRRGTGFYKVPSLRGVWYRGPFQHSGSAATLEDWFDPRRLEDDYVPTGYRGPDGKARSVPGHRFGLSLSEEDRQALIAFLKTL